MQGILLSSFLAKLIGLYLLIIAVIWLVRRKQFEKSAKEILASGGLLALSASFSLLFGLFIAIDHPIWEWSWRGLITVLGYLSILKGVVRLVFADKIKMIPGFIVFHYRWVFIIILVALGLFLTYHGFVH